MGPRQVNTQILEATANMMVADGKGLLAIDESTGTCNKRFAKWDIPQTAEARRQYRELIVNTPGLNESISGAILYNETIRQKMDDGTPFAKALAAIGIIPGIKVDLGAKEMAAFPGERVTEGLDGLRVRLAEYAQMGARFAKWRAVFTIGDSTPSCGCIEANAQALARYAGLSQEAGLVPVVEPEVLMEGDHTLEACSEVTERVLITVFRELHSQRVKLEGMILKPNMVLPGATCNRQESVEEVADATVHCLLRSVPAAVPGVVFLSGGQSGELASARLNAMNGCYKSRLPWQLSFSFGRAIQEPALEIWHGEPANVVAAQEALYHRAKCDRAAHRGEYNAAVEAEHKKSEPDEAGSRVCRKVQMKSKIRQKFIVGNWKMHTTSLEAQQLAQAIVNGFAAPDHVTVVLCPPFPYLPVVRDMLRGSRIKLGAQNMYPEAEGAYTGEVGSAMLLDLHCKYVIVGHSERRHKLGESDALINRKVTCALASGLHVILCVGETLEQRQGGRAEAVLDHQLSTGLAEVTPERLSHLSIAYEPVWAIGNDEHHATPQQAHNTHVLIRKKVGQILGAKWSEELAVFYGGSVEPINAPAFLSQDGIDGVLIGGASLKADEFLAIVNAGIHETEVEIQTA